MVHPPGKAGGYLKEKTTQGDAVCIVTKSPLGGSLFAIGSHSQWTDVVNTNMSKSEKVDGVK